jgi:hypothetical protein
LTAPRNGGAALGVLDFALVIGANGTAWKVLDQIEAHCAHQVDREALAQATALRRRYRLFTANDYDKCAAGVRRRPITTGPGLARAGDPVWSKNWNGRRTCGPWSVASLPGAPELGQRIAKVLCGFRDLLIAAAGSD